MNTDALRWIKVADYVHEIAFAPNNLAQVEAGGRKICLGRHNGQLFAFAPKCPHAGGRLVHGYIDASGNVVCPLHRYKFSMKNGRNMSGEGYYLKHWPVEVREEGVFVGMEEKSWFF